MKTIYPIGTIFWAVEMHVAEIGRRSGAHLAPIIFWLEVLEIGFETLQQNGSRNASNISFSETYA